MKILLAKAEEYVRYQLLRSKKLVEEEKDLFIENSVVMNHEKYLRGAQQVVQFVSFSFTLGESQKIKLRKVQAKIDTFKD